jgi:hypothetical protein
MSRFVEDCRKEWHRLGVPEVVSNEMASDLAADLSEAEAEGASAEQVLGNGVFDARSFAASWATARGVVPQGRPIADRPRPARWWVVAFAVVSFVVALAGVAAFSQHRESAAIAMVRHSVNLPFPGRPAIRIGPGLPGHFVLAQGGPLQALGLVMLVAGLVGLGLTLWLWKPWSGTRRRSSIDEDAGLPSYL